MPEDLEAGNAYLQLMAGGANLQRDVDRKVRKVKAPDIVAEIDAKIGKLEAEAAKAREVLKSVKDSAPDPQIGLDIAELEAKASLVRQRLTDLGQKESTPKVRADIATAEANLGRIENRVDALKAKSAVVRVGGNVDAAERDLNRIEAKLTALRGQRATVELNSRGAPGVIAALDAVEQKRRGLNGSHASVSIAASGGAQASGILGAIVAGLAAVASAAPAAVGGLSAVLSAGTAAAQAGIAVKAGYSGIGDAIKSVEADEKSAATSSAGSAKTRTNSASQIASAQAALASAVTAADRAAITGADQVADASRAEARAAVQADRARITSSQQVAAARRAVADAVVAASERTQSAERAVGQAQQSVQFAQESLTRARRDAVEANEDLQLSLSGIAISERRAMLSQKKAQAALAKGASDPLEQEELQLNVDEATQNLAEVRERYGDLRQQQAQWAKSGVEGSNQVTAATRSLRDAQLSAQDSVRALATAQRDGSRSVQDALIAQAQAQQQASWTAADARDAQIDAAIATARAARDAGWSQQDAARGVADAQRGLQQALASTADSAGAAGSAGKQSAADLAKLTPAGREYVRFWTQEWKPAWQDVADATAGELLPRIESAQRRVLGLQPLFKSELAGTASVIGDLAIRGADLATSPAFRRDFGAIMDSNNRSLQSWGQAGLYGADAARSLTVAGLPLSERLARVAASSMQSVDSFLLQKEASGELGEFMQFAGDKVGELWHLFVELATAGYEVSRAVAPVGAVVLDVATGTAHLVGELAEAHPGLIQFAAACGIGLAAVNGLAKGTVALKASAALSTTGLTTLAGGLQLLNPAAVASSGFIGGLMTKTSGLAQKFGVSSIAANTFGARVGVAASGLPLLGAGIALAAAGMDAMGTSTDEATAALARGGAAAVQMRADLAEADQKGAWSIGNLGNALTSGVMQMLGFQTTTEKATAELAKQRAEMSNLERAQSYATEAQGNYEAAVRQFGAASPQAAAALRDLTARTRDLEIAQVSQREKTDLATAAIIYQRDQILAGLDANLRARMAAQQLSKDQGNLAKAIRDHGAASQEATDASLQLERSQLDAANSAKASAGGQQAYVQSVRDMVAATKGELTPTLAGMVQSLGQADLAAAGATVKFDAAGRAVATFPGGKTVTLDANTSQVYPQLAAVKAAVDSTRGTIGVDADTGPGVATVGGFKLQTDLTRGVVTVDGNILPADQQRLGIKAKTDGTTGTMWINGNAVPCDGQLNGARFRVDATTGVMSIDANPDDANRKSDATHDRANNPETFDVHANVQPAKDGWSSFLDWVNGQVNDFNRMMGFNWFQRNIMGREGYAQGGLVEAYATGGRVQGFPTGGNVRGPGTATSDSIPALLSDGEYVIRAAAVQRVGVPALNAINALRDGGPVRLATGGPAPGTLASPGSAASVASGPDSAAVAVDADQQAAAAAGMDLVAEAALAQAAAITDTLVPALLAQQEQSAATQAGQQALVAAGITPLVESILTTLVPAVGLQAPLAHEALQAAQALTRGSTSATAMSTQSNSTWMAAATAAMSLAAQAQHAGLRAGQVATQQSTGVTAAVTAARNAEMMGSTGQMTAVNQGHLTALRGAQGVTQQATAAFADAWRAQLGRTMPDSANPLRWVINFPIRGITDAWNHLDGQFALGKHVNPFVPGFASGGQVHGPGTGTSDSVPAMLSAGEFVVRESVASAHMPFLDALNRGQPEARQAAGGRHQRLQRYAGGGAVVALENAKRFAAAQAGKPYIWGGVGPAGYDCSGFMSAITNVLRGQAPHNRLGVARSVPWPGFARGLGGAFAQGASAVHTAGTLGGVNVESGGSPSRTKFGAGAVGADNGQFPVKAWLPTVGGQFLSGGAGGGGGFFDPTPMVDDAFRKAYAQIAEVPKYFGPSAQVARDQGIARFSADKVKAKALEQLMASFGGGGAGTEQWRPLVRAALARVGQSLGLDNITLRRMNQESGGNPRAINNWDSNAKKGTPSKGLMQVIDPTFASNRDPGLPNNIWDPMANVVASMRYTLGRYGSLPAGYNRAGGYANGGVVPGPRHAREDTVPAMLTPGERVLTPVQAGQYDTLSQLVGRRGVRVEGLSDGGGYQGPTNVIHIHPRAEQSEEHIGDAVMRRLDFAIRS